MRALDGESLTEGLGAEQGGERFHGGIFRFVARFLETDEIVIWLQSEILRFAQDGKTLFTLHRADMGRSVLRPYMFEVGLTR